jgi:hypothetical protein
MLYYTFWPYAYDEGYWAYACLDHREGFGRLEVMR